MSYWNELERHPHPDEFWMGHPLVRIWINEHVSGAAAAWPLDWFAAKFGSRLDGAEVLSVGCGTGGLERDLSRRFPTARITGIDMSERAIEAAREEAAKEQLRASSINVATPWQSSRGRARGTPSSFMRRCIISTGYMN